MRLCYDMNLEKKNYFFIAVIGVNQYFVLLFHWTFAKEKK